MEAKTSAFVVSYDGPDSGRKLLGVVTALEAGETLIGMDFMKNQDHESFCVAYEAVRYGEGTTRFYPVIEHGEDPENSEEYYMIQETQLY